MAGAFAEMERALIGERTSAALQHKKANGVRLGGMPYGFTAAAAGGELLPNPDELEAVRLILDLRARDPASSFRQIARSLNAGGYPTRRRAPWKAATVRKIVMRAETYCNALRPCRPPNWGSEQADCG
jgi:DNA invertase Pin-like site-specific DNA recombinase